MKILKLKDEITTFFQNSSGDTVSVTHDMETFLNKTEEDLYEDLEESYHNHSCTNESNNFCECSPLFEDFEITSFETRSIDMSGLNPFPPLEDEI